MCAQVPAPAFACVYVASRQDDPAKNHSFSREISRSVARISSTPGPMTEARLRASPRLPPTPWADCRRPARFPPRFHAYTAGRTAPAPAPWWPPSVSAASPADTPGTDPRPAHGSFTNQLRRCLAHNIISWFNFSRPPPPVRVCLSPSPAYRTRNADTMGYPLILWGLF